MDPTFQHGIDYPAIDINLAPREIARLSQSNVTLDHELGLKYAAAGRDRVLGDLPYSVLDPTLVSEIDAKGGLRAAQTGRYDLPYVKQWFDEANALMPDTARGRRELVAVDHLDMRARGIFIGRALLESKPRHLSDKLKAEISEAENKAESAIRRAVDPREPYLPLTYGHFATFEAMVNHPVNGLMLAITGIGKAIIARGKEANQTEVRSRLARAVDRAKFIGKQTLYNTAAGVLSVTAPISLVPKIGKLHTKTALKMLS